MSSSRTLFHLWCVLVVFSSHTHIGYGARTDLRRSPNLYKDRHIQPSDAEYFNPEPLDGTSVEKWSNKEEGKRDDSVVRVSRSTKRADGLAICGKKNSKGVEWSCKNIASCQFAEKLLSMKQQTVCGGEGSSQKICCPDRINPVKVAQEKCEEYVSESTSTRNKREARIPHVRNHPENKRTAIGEFPHMALIGSKNADDPTSSKVVWNCGGSLISHQYILTAAHCNNTKFAALTPTWVVLGNITKPSNNEREFETKDNVYRISKSIKYPGYNLLKFDNDIALFKLNRSVNKFNRQIRPACLALPPNVKYNDRLAIVTGWGQTKANGIPSEKLLETSISILNNSMCEKAFKNKTTMLSKGFDAVSMICARNLSSLDGGTCSGDSGGPLQYRIDDSTNYSGMWFQEGITSFGKPNCEDPEPKVFTRVPHFLPWIQSIVWPTEDLI